MKLKYLVGLFLIVLISGCATAPTTPPAEDVTAPAEEVTTPEPVETTAEAAETVIEQAPAGADVQILKNAFEPAKLTVKAGATVSFKNMDNKRHSLTVKGAASSQGSGNIEPGKIYEHTFEKAGTYTIMAIPGAFKAEITVE